MEGFEDNADIEMVDGGAPGDDLPSKSLLVAALPLRIWPKAHEEPIRVNVVTWDQAMRLVGSFVKLSSGGASTNVGVARADVVDSASSTVMHFHEPRELE